MPDAAPPAPADPASPAAPLRLPTEPVDFRAIVDAAPDLVTVIDATGRVVWDNPAVEEVLGYPQGSLVGRTAFELIHPHDYGGAVALLAELAGGVRPSATLSARFRRADGEWCRLHASGRLLRRAGGEVRIVVSSRVEAPALEEAAAPEVATALAEARVEVVERLARAAEFRDDDTGRHLRRVGELAAAVARRMGLPEEEVAVLGRAAPLHDVGKIAIPDAILRKPGPLDPEETAVMRTHTLLGARILEGGGSALVRSAEAIALSHHERWDGAGYPWRLAAEEIPLSARIVSLVDFFDALTHDRPYRRAWPVPRVAALVRDEAGTRFDPAVVAAFLEELTGGAAEAGDQNARVGG